MNSRRDFVRRVAGATAGVAIGGGAREYFKSELYIDSMIFHEEGLRLLRHRLPLRLAGRHSCRADSWPVG